MAACCCRSAAVRRTISATASQWAAPSSIGRISVSVDAPEEALWMLAHPQLHAGDGARADCDASRRGGLRGVARHGLLRVTTRRRRSPRDRCGRARLSRTAGTPTRMPFDDAQRARHSAVDRPGTGSYTADPEARDRFRSSPLHNTVVVDGRSQSVPSGPFHWSHTAHGTAHTWRTNPGSTTSRRRTTVTLR